MVDNEGGGSVKEGLEFVSPFNDNQAEGGSVTEGTGGQAENTSLIEEVEAEAEAEAEVAMTEINPRNVLEMIALVTRAERVDKGVVSEFGLVISHLPGLDQLLESDDLNKRAMGFDLKAAILRKNLGLVEMYKKEKKMDASQAENYRMKIEKELEEIKKERQDLINQGVEGTNQVEQAAVLLAGDGTEEKESAQSNPLGFLEKKLNEAMRSRQKKRVFFEELKERLGISEEIIMVLDKKMSQVLKKEKKQQRGEIVQKVKSTGFLSLLLLFLSAYAAKKATDGQQGG